MKITSNKQNSVVLTDSYRVMMKFDAYRDDGHFIGK